MACRTAYPFESKAALTIETDGEAAFPLYLRVPGWCRGFRVRANGQPVDVQPPPGSYVRLEHNWRGEDKIEAEMPMEVSLTRWPRTGSVTVDRGLLSYSVAIDEQWKQCGGSEEWPEWEVFPASAWNFGLVLEDDNPAGYSR